MEAYTGILSHTCRGHAARARPAGWWTMDTAAPTGDSDEQKPRESHCDSFSFSPAMLPDCQRSLHLVIVEVGSTLHHSTGLRIFFILYFFSDPNEVIQHKDAVQGNVLKSWSDCLSGSLSPPLSKWWSWASYCASLEFSSSRVALCILMYKRWKTIIPMLSVQKST